MSVAMIMGLFVRLPYAEQLRLYRALKQQMWGDERPPDYKELFTKIRESRFTKGHICPRCGSKKVHRYGQYRDRQRYRCNGCGRTYNDLTYSPLSGTWYVDRMAQFFELMIKGQSLVQCALALKISLSTAFFWRHKILASLKANDFERMSGIVEADETTVLESEKGTRNIAHRKPRKRGGKAKKRGLSHERVSIIVALDRKENTAAMVAGRGQATTGELTALLKDLIDPKAQLCSDAAGNLAAFARARGLKHQPVNASKGERVRGIFHIQHANSFHRRMKQWMDRFQGVATKYMNNYLYWFHMLEKLKRFELFKRDKRMLFSSNLTPIKVLCLDYRPCLNGM